jgi:ABC-2 type transport system permease protein
VTATARDGVFSEVGKLGAFVRRDLLTAWSYRLPFVTDWLSLVVQAFVFGFVGRLIPSEALPTYGGRPVSYLEFVAVGISLASFMALGLGRLTNAIRQEQVQGTLESLLLTPTAWSTIEIGSAFYDLLYVPIRTFIFLLLTVAIFGASYDTGGLLPAAVVLVVFIPLVWGLGVISAAATVTFRRGNAGVGFLTTLATLGSGAYFPLDVMPEWVQRVAVWNPIAIAVTAMRDALLGGATMADVLPAAMRLLPMVVVTLILGAVAFRAAIQRERRHGTLGLY